MADETLATAAHEAGHERAFRDHGTRAHGIKIFKGGTRGYIHAPMPTKYAAKDKVAGYQIGCMAGAAMAKEYHRRTGTALGNSAGESQSDLQGAQEMSKLPGAISLDEARVRAVRHVRVNYDKIIARAERLAQRHDGRKRTRERGR